jgi:hypothetical protein
MASMKRNVRSKMSNKEEITLMTLLANEATAGSRKLLKQYGERDATDFKDLELKLAELYFKTPDKVKFEKELASIHPHRKWIAKNIEPVEVVKVETEIKPVEKKCNCQDNNCPNMSIPYGYLNQMSSFDGQVKESKTNQWEAFIGPIGMLAIIGMTFLILNSQISKHN